MSLLPEPPYKHGSAPKIGVLLINLGTPDAPTIPAVRRYLKEFLSDARVVEIWRPLWWLILHLFVLTTRPKKSAQRYAQIWTTEGSPLKVHTERQTKLLRGYLGTRVKIPIVIDYAMRYGQPAIDKTVAALKAQGCDRILALPLYPQYASSTTATAMDALMRAYEKLRNQPALRSVRSFHDDPAYIEALAHSVSDHWLKHGRPEKLVMSFHGVPRVILERGDPYHCECQKTARLLAEALGLPQEKYAIAFQSRFGAAEWLKPYTTDVLHEYGKQKLRRIDVVCPGFVSDCLETLEEIAIEGKALFLNAGGGEYHYIPCLNERDDWIHALTDLVARNLLGWVTHTPSSDELERSRLLALAAGAKN